MNQATEKSVIELPAQHFTRSEERDLPAVVSATPMSMLATAVQRGMDVTTIKDLMDLQERWEKNEARKAYAQAKAAFKANPPTVYKDKKNIQYDSMYASIGNLVNTVNAALSPHGLDASWDIDQSGGIKVTCILTHRAGHSERVSMSGPADDSGKKNPLQQIKSTVTYLKIATFEAVTGIASSDASGGDDDGNGATGMPDEEFKAWVKKIKDATTKEAAKATCAEAIKIADSHNDLSAYKALKQVLKEQNEFIDKAEK